MLTGRPDYWLLICFVALLPLGCGAANSGPATAEVPTQDLPVYDGEQARWFDDSISPAVFGLDVDRAPPKQDKVLLERSRRADHVQRVRLRTIREERFDGIVRYKLVVQRIGGPLAGTPLQAIPSEDGVVDEQAPPDEVELTVGRASPSLSLLRSMTVEVVGARFILFVKRFQLNGEQVLHFRGEPDQDDVVEAIAAANATSLSP